MTPQEEYVAEVTRPGQSKAMTEFLGIVASLNDEQFWRFLRRIIALDDEQRGSASA